MRSKKTPKYAGHLEKAKPARVVEVNPKMLSLHQTPHRINQRHVVVIVGCNRCQSADTGIGEDDHHRQQQGQREIVGRRHPSVALLHGPAPSRRNGQS